jgi:glycosyltransferase involved in cell wall biosynthesis
MVCSAVDFIFVRLEAVLMEFPLVSVLFLSYKRVPYLRAAIGSFRANTEYPNLEFVISDDGSPESDRFEISSLGADRVCFSKQNFGLGNNINKGLLACRGDFVLVIQDDWICNGPNSYLLDSVKLLRINKDISVVRFYGVKLKQLREEIKTGFFSMVPDFSSVTGNFYSDTPHLRRASFSQEIGPYEEGVRMEETEIRYSRRVMAAGVKIVFAHLYSSVFKHEGENASFRTSTADYWAQKKATEHLAFLRSSPVLYSKLKALYRWGVSSCVRITYLLKRISS